MIICLCGPESTGKSVLATQLANHLARQHDVRLVPEYARTYLTAKEDSLYDAEDLLHIAKVQWQQEQAAIRQHQCVILDTDLLNIQLWSLLRYQSCDPWITRQAHQGVATRGYLLLAPDLPYVADPLREGGDREALFQHWQRLLEHEGARHQVITGHNEHRLAAALAAIASLFT